MTHMRESITEQAYSAFLAYGREFYGADKYVYTFNVQFCWTENFAKIFLEFVRQISN